MFTVRIRPAPFHVNVAPRRWHRTGRPIAQAAARTLALVERRLSQLVLILEAANRPAEKLAVENILREVRAALAPRGLRRIS